MSEAAVSFLPACTRPEVNSDHSTHGIISRLIEGGHIYQSMDELMASGRPAFIIQAATVVHEVLPALKRLARVKAEEVAARANRLAWEPGRWKEPPTPAHIAAEVLLDPTFRRGRLPSPEGRESRVRHIRYLQQADPGCLRMAILALPLRDGNPAKNDGPFPDLGEAAAMLRMWVAARAIYLATEGMGPAQGGWEEVRVLIARDPIRYPPFLSFPARAFQRYANALGFLQNLLAIDDHLEIATLEELTSKIPPEDLTKFRYSRDRVYRECLEERTRSLEKGGERLASLDRNAFAEAMEVLAPGSNWAALFETILHTRRHPALDGFTPAARLRFLSGIYGSAPLKEWENLRKQVLWESLEGMAQYLAAYEANTSAANGLGLDDLELAVPHHLRLSIHRKPEPGLHFSVNFGPSSTRTPWHGTAGVYYSTRRKAIALETRLSLELKEENYLPVLVDAPQAPPGLFREMASIRQPLVWISRGLVEGEPTGVINPGDGFIGDLFKSSLKHF